MYLAYGHGGDLDLPYWDSDDDYGSEAAAELEVVKDELADVKDELAEAQAYLAEAETLLNSEFLSLERRLYGLPGQATFEQYRTDMQARYDALRDYFERRAL